jgi:molybdenum cofactor cytidylyltransferase
VIAAILLAAGESKRFGAPKLLQAVGGGPAVIMLSAETLQHARGDELVDVLIAVVDKPKHESGTALTLSRSGFKCVVSPGGGMGHSLAAGVAAVADDASAILVVLGDEPFIPEDVIPQLLARFNSGGAHIVVPRYRGERGHPVLFGRAAFPELLALGGDQGARSVIDRDPSRVAFVDLDLPKPADVDTPDDLARLRW